MWAGIFPPGPGERDSGRLEQVLWIAQAEEALQRLALVRQYGGILAQRRKEEAEKLWESGVRKEEIPAPKGGQKKEMGIGIDGMMAGMKSKLVAALSLCLVRMGKFLGELSGVMLGLEGKAVVIGDGASWIVDWYHAVEHLWGLGREAFGERAYE